MSTQHVEQETPLSMHVAANIRAEAARLGWSQGKLALALGMARVTVSDRYTGRTPWTLDEMQKAARAFRVPLAVLYAIRDSNPEPADSKENVVDLHEWRGRPPKGTAEALYGPEALWGRLEVVR